jgi:fluoroquinolone transport system permease protein
MSAVAAFARNDAAGIRRDSMLRMLIIAPFFYVAMVRFPVPPLTTMLDQRYGFDLVPYYPVIVAFFTIIGSAMILSALGGMVILEEKDTHTLGALQVTPVTMTTYAAYRSATIVGVTMLYALFCALLSGLTPSGVLPGLLAAALCAGLMAAVIAVFIALVSDNKVEGLAVLRAVGMLVMLVPIVPFFFDGARWEAAFWLLPSYWPNKIYWLAADGATFWPYAVAGIAYNSVLLALAIRAFNRRVG